jgi:hypothetical protein
MAKGLMSSASGVVARFGQDFLDGFKARLLAAGWHLVISFAVASCVIALVYRSWYPGPLRSISGVDSILLMLLAIDVTLGPLLTLFVFDRTKKSLRFDLSCIAFMQVAALSYGLFTVEAGRPHYLVFVKDRFEVISRADLQPADRDAAAGNPAAYIDWLGPRVVAAEMPESKQEREDLMFESLLGGRDVQHLPKQYRDYASQAARAADRSSPIPQLRALNGGGGEVLASAIERTGLAEEELRYVPIRGPQGDATMLIEASTGAVSGMAATQPWR